MQTGTVIFEPSNYSQEQKMNSIKLLGFCLSSFLVLATISGCGGKPEPVQEATAPTDGYPIVNELARTDINDKARALLEQYNRGKSAPRKKVIDSIVKRAVEENRSQRFQVNASFKFEGVYFDTPPTQSKPQAANRTLDYSSSPKNCREFNASLLRCRSAATEHFRKTYHDLPQKDLDALCSFFDATLDYEIYSPTKERKENFAKQFNNIKVPDLIANDPWFRLCHAYADYHVSKNYERATTKANDAIEGFAETDYPAQSIWLAHNYSFEMRNAWRLFQADDSKNAIRLSHLKKYADIIYYSLAIDFRVKDDEVRAIWYMFDESVESLRRYQQPEIVEALCKKLLESPNLDPWLSAMIRGRLAQFRAWQFRGNGYASTVTEEGWQGFSANMKIAEKAYKKALKLNPHAPEPAAGLQETAFAGHTEQSGEYWLEKALEIQPDFYPAIDTVIHFNRPRWGGSLKKMMNAGEQFSRQGDYQTIAPFGFIDAYVTAVSDEDCYIDGTVAEQLGEAQIKRLRDCAIKLSQSEEVHGYGFVLSREWMQTCAFAFSYLANDGQLILKDYQRLHGNYVEEAAQRLQLKLIPERLYEQALAVHGPFAPLYEEMAQYENMKIEELLKSRQSVRNLKAKAKADGAEQQVLTSIQRITNRVNYHEKYQTGDWVDLKFDEFLTDWRTPGSNSVQYESEDSVIFRGDSDNREDMIFMYHQFPGPRTIEFEVTWLTEQSEVPPTISTGFWPMTFEQGFSVHCGINPNSRQLRYGSPAVHQWHGKGDWFITKEGSGVPFDGLKSVTMRFNVHENYYEFFINDQFVLNQFSEDFSPKTNLSFGNPNNHPGKYEARFSNIRVKKWQGTPQPQDPKEILAYYDRLTETDPQSAMYWRLRGKAAHALSQFELSLLFSKSLILQATSIRSRGTSS